MAPARQPPPPPSPPGSRTTLTGTISTGPVVVVGSETSEPESPTSLQVNDKSHPLAGLEIVIPAGSYREPLLFKVSYAPVNSTTFKNVKPVSPLIIVENGGAYANQTMTVKVPVTIGANQFAMGFYYDAAAGTLEGMPLVDADASSVTVATQHFSSFFISAVDAAILSANIDSGFRPGTDDWQFVNNGSALEPKGHCAGQSLSAMWYYVTRPDGKTANLNGRYDRNGKTPATPDFQWDDSLSYRFASVIQHDINWDNKDIQYFRDLYTTRPQLSLRAFAYSILATGEPQYVRIRSSTGGHALVAYRVDNGKLYVADPNYPGNNERSIEFSGGKFQPYESGANAQEIAAGKSTRYDTICYIGKSAFVDWNKISARWKEMKAGTIGAGLFPEYEWQVTDDKGQKDVLEEGFLTSKAYLDWGYYLDPKAGKNVYYFFTLDGKSVKLDKDGNVPLFPGNNQVGFAFFTTSLNTKGETLYHFIDYATRNVYRMSLAIDPSVVRAQVNQDCAFNASMPNPPAGVRYDWLVNGTRQQTGPSAAFKFRFATAGTFDVGLKAFDSAGKELGTASASAIISAASPTATATPRPTTTTPPATTATPVSRLSQLQKKTVFNASVGTADGTLSYRMEYPGSSRDAKTFTVSGGSWNTGVAGGIKITWSGASFSGTDTVKSSNSTKITTRTVQGTVSADGNTVTSLTYSVVSKWPESENKEYQVVAQNISLARYWGDSSSLFISGAQAASVIGKVTEKTERAYSTSSRSFTEVMTLTSIDWKSSDRNTAAASFE